MLCVPLGQCMGPTFTVLVGDEPNIEVMGLCVYIYSTRSLIFMCFFMILLLLDVFQ